MNKRKRRVVSTWLDDYFIQKIEELVNSGEYNNPSELIREAVRFWFRQREERFLMIRRKVEEPESDE